MTIPNDIHNTERAGKTTDSIDTMDTISTHSRVAAHEVLSEKYTIPTPENVSIGYAVAGIGNRFIAALIDSALLGAALVISQVLLVVTLAQLGETSFVLDAQMMNWRQGIVVALYALGVFGLIWGYYILFEWFWQGQTPGKRATKIRVVRLDGSPPRFLDIAVRNLVRILDFLPVGYGVGLVVMFFNREARRLGDLAAGVMVVKSGGELRLEDVTGPVRATPRRADSPFAQQPATRDIRAAEPGIAFSALRRLRVADVTLIQESLARFDAGTLEAALLIRLAVVMGHKAGAYGPHAEPRDLPASRQLLLLILDAYGDLTGDSVQAPH